MGAIANHGYVGSLVTDSLEKNDLFISDVTCPYSIHQGSSLGG